MKAKIINNKIKKFYEMKEKKKNKRLGPINLKCGTNWPIY